MRLARGPDDADVIRARLRALLTEGSGTGWVPEDGGSRHAPPVSSEQESSDEADDDEPDEGAPAQTWMLATTHPSAILRTPDESRAAAYDALVADLRVVAHALA